MGLGAGLALAVRCAQYGRVPSGTSTRRTRKPLIPKKRERDALRKRVGAFLRERRLELGLTQAQITQALGYVSLLCAAAHNKDHVPSSVM